MRIGKTPKRSRSSKTNEVTTAGIGQTSCDVISTIYKPKMIQLASESLDQYATLFLQYEEAIKEVKARNEAMEVEIDIDGSITTTSDIPMYPKAPFYSSQTRIDDVVQNVFDDVSHHFTTSNEYKVSLKAAKFERLLNEKYGIFRPMIQKHPQIEQLIRSLHRKYITGYFNPIRQKSLPISRSTSIILLFMMYRSKVPIMITLLTGLFLLIGLQPWALLMILIIGRYIFHQRKRRIIFPALRKQRNRRTIPAIPPYYHTKDKAVSSSDTSGSTKAKYDQLLLPVGRPLCTDENMIDTSMYDVIMIGHGIGTLYTASLLSRIGRKVLVLSSEVDASGCVTFQNVNVGVTEPKVLSTATTDSTFKNVLKNLVFDVENNHIPKLSRQLELLIPALTTTLDCQGGIRFAKIGSIYDDYAHGIISIPGIGQGCQNNGEILSYGGGGDVPFILKGSGGLTSIANDAAEYFGDQYPDNDIIIADNKNESLSGRYITNCLAINAKASVYYLTKIISEASHRILGTSTYQQITGHSTSEYLNQNFPLHPHLRSMMAAIGMCHENISPSSTCLAAHVTNICHAINEEGMHYPIGGPRALCHALANIIESNGGRIITNAPLSELVFDKSISVATGKKKSKDESDINPPYCVGVKLRTGTEIRFSVDRYTNEGLPPHCPVVVAMDGFIQTFIRHLADDIRTEYKVPRGVPALSERRPVLHLLFALRGSAMELDVTGADYYRVPGAAVPVDNVNPTTGEIQYGDIGWVDDDRSSSTNTDTNDVTEKDTDTSEVVSNGTVRRKKKKNMKFEIGYSWMRISFPSAKDPSFTSRFGNITTCVVTVEADDDFVQQYDTKPRIFMRKKPTASTADEIQRLSERVKKDLLNLYPQLSDKIIHSEISGPYEKGLSHNPERYTSKGIRTDTPYPGLYVGGSDLVIGDSFSGSILGGWLIANTICGYSTIDYLFLRKHITYDLQQLLEPPSNTSDPDDDEILAVPYEPIAICDDDEEEDEIELKTDQ